MKKNFKDLKEIIEYISHYLPSQGPVRTFIHHNTLHHFENQPFFEAVENAGQIYDAQAYLSEARYQSEYFTGRIENSDLNKSFDDFDYSEPDIFLNISNKRFLRSLLVTAPPRLSYETLRWKLIENRELEFFSDHIFKKTINEFLMTERAMAAKAISPILPLDSSYEKQFSKLWPNDISSFHDKVNIEDLDNLKLLNVLWHVSIQLAGITLKDDKERDLVPEYDSPNHISSYIHESKLSTEEELVNTYLIKFTSAFLDVGLSHLSISDKEQGLLEVFLSHLKNDTNIRPSWLHNFSYDKNSRSSIQIIEDITQEIGVSKQELSSFLLRKSLILKGWAGLVHQSEIGVVGLGAQATLSDFIAVRLILEQAARLYIAKTGYGKNLIQEVDPLDLMNRDSSAIFTLSYHLFKAFQFSGIGGYQILSLDQSKLNLLYNLISDFSTIKRLRIWQSAYEWNLYSRTASAIISKNKNYKEKETIKPKCQIVCCIDDREESFRRYIEEISPEYETFGTAGFFGVDAEFHSIYESPAAFCPVNVVPTHKIDLVAKSGSKERLLGLGKAKQLQSDFSVFLETHSRSLIRGWLLAVGGILALVPLSISTLSPRWPHQFKRFLKRMLVNPNDETALVYAQDADHPEDTRFTLEEMALRVRALLMTTGLIKNLAPLVVITGHGSFSSNNPYRSAYDCGACGGRPGRVNPRVFALMANRKDVREFLLQQDIIIPTNTHFLGAFHNTCTDEVEYFDTEEIPDTHLKLFQGLQKDIEIARSKNALERCRRFDEVQVMNEKEALAHVESRAHHIAQPRPEYGHATNAICFVGRRSITKNIFFDRRSFLVSYDPTVDKSSESLKNILKAVIPVCMGINLEYFFSSLDNQRYGAGSKLPHNVTSLLGLMTGYCSDLRTGLPAQMVEIHEPTRLLFILDTTPEVVAKLMMQDPVMDRAVRNRWISLMIYNELDNSLEYYGNNNELQTVKDVSAGIRTVNSSLEWVVGKKEHLDFVAIKS